MLLTPFDFSIPVTADTNVYAKWFDKEVKVTFDLNGHGSEIAPARTVDGKVPKPQNPTEIGWMLVYWSTTSDGEIEFDFSTVLNEDTVLYAIWEPEYIVTFDMRGKATPIEPVYTVNKKALRPVDPTNSEGWTFDGWYTDVEYNNEFDFDTVLTQNTTLYAKWIEEYTVTFDMCGYGQQIDPITTLHGVATRPVDPTEEGWGFAGWYTEVDCINEFDFNTILDEDIILYAKWIKEYQVTFDMQGHGNNITVMTVLGKVTRPEDPEFDGYEFNGWFVDKECTTPFDFDDAFIQHDTTVYAGWIEIPEYEVTFDMQGHGRQIASTLTENGIVTKPANPQENGWIFGGWYIDKDCHKEFDFNAKITENIVLYAKWTEELVPDPEYTVTFDLNGHGDAIENVATIDGKVTKPSDPTARGWTFCGWYTDPELQNKFDFDTEITEDITLYAKWTKNKLSNLWWIILLAGILFFFFIILLFKRKKDEDEDLVKVINMKDKPGNAPMTSDIPNRIYIVIKEKGQRYKAYYDENRRLISVVDIGRRHHGN